MNAARQGSLRIVGIIPSRMAASRLPGKPLARIAGLPMIEHIFRRASMSPLFAEVVMATCDREIVEASEAFGCRAIMTSATHVRGTERVAEAARAVPADVYVNIQGDEPLLRPEIFDPLLAPFLSGEPVSVTNLKLRLTSQAELDNPNNVKVVASLAGDALYFSRASIPTETGARRDGYGFRQIGIYAFTARALQQFVELPQSPHEQLESCDMMRFVDNGIPVRMVEHTAPLQSVDTPEDLAAAERLMAADDLAPRYLR